MGLTREKHENPDWKNKGKGRAFAEVLRVKMEIQEVERYRKE